jgi:HSP20 family molecular chaperone IbpA
VGSGSGYLRRKNNIIVKAELPGMKKDNLSIDVK